MTWPVLKKLYALYNGERVLKSPTLLDDAEVSHMIHTTNLIGESRKEITALDGFPAHFENMYADRLFRYQSFFQKYPIEKPQSRFELEDIDTLISIDEQMENGELNDIRQQIIAYDESVRGISQMFFKHDKYLENKQPLIDALKLILKVESFADNRDQQYMYRLECHNPRCIVLCENLDFLRKPAKPRKHGIELWYAGGRNIAKLEYSDRRALPIFYSCDWDFDGLDIYLSVKEMFPGIKLLYPNGLPRGLELTEHQSLWGASETGRKCGGLPTAKFTEQEQRLILDLVAKAEWIIEESNDLLVCLDALAL